jgi:Tol biopolymer transport system component
MKNYGDTHNSNGHTELSWSPDGKEIAFSATKSEPAELYLMENFLKPGK